MDPLPKVTEASIRQHVSSDSDHRGREYCEQKAVVSSVCHDQLLQAEVEGSQYEPYRVRITYDIGGFVQACCTCPYDWGSWCKHIVVTILTTMQSPTTVEEQPSMQTLLVGLERKQWQALLLYLVEQQPDWADVVEAQGHRVHLHAARWFEKVRAVYRTAGRETKWQAYRAKLMTRYRRKYCLIPRLEVLQRQVLHK
jgi:uncharacterized Zn finger protein